MVFKATRPFKYRLLINIGTELLIHFTLAFDVLVKPFPIQLFMNILFYLLPLVKLFPTDY